ncbi:DUF2892 domain-containing protein [Neptunomonas sp.]|uniref:YgaP family membrane protein n=1 Tax=Neptunomonas sp. TaxID=1971898 RepID=UPI0025F8F1AF|nr:DUF2892 domain-containing protein [Neptunomonas sp.]
MEKNIGSVDKILRILVGLALIALAVVGPQIVWGWIGVPFILIALFGWCPIYKILGVSSCKSCN